ncbi:glycerate-2-kinase family protein [Desulfobacterales bacterium HSG2]|nr:glycerate-2-kinase family protein [Desulfobacterales bacterium HSG2]
MRKNAAAIFYKGSEAVEAGAAVKRYCKIEGSRLFIGSRIYNLSGFKNLFVVGAGKASAPMGAAIEDLLGKRITNGLINVKYGHMANLTRIRLREAGHPVPDENGQDGAAAILDIVKSAGKDDLVLCLFSGGGSALLPLPCHNLALKDKQDNLMLDA